VIAGRLLLALASLTALVGVAWVFSTARRRVEWRLVPAGIALQIGFALFVLDVPGGRWAFDALAGAFVNVLGFVAVGTRFVFGDLADSSKLGFVLALQVLPTIVFFASLTGVLYHLGVMPRVVRAMAWAVTRVMNVSGAEATVVSASVFVGQTEAPLTVRPYIEGMTEAELMTMMVGGMAHVAGSVMAAYVSLLGGDDLEQRRFYAKHLLAASAMAAPATLLVAKILVPETATPATRGKVTVAFERTTSNVIDAAAAGAADGLKLALNVGAMLLAFVALVALVNAPIHWLGTLAFDRRGTTVDGWLTAAAGREVTLSLQTLLGVPMAPVAWLAGVPWRDAPLVGSFLGEKVVLNEFVAYVDLAQHLAALEARSRVVAAYALCGFANFASIAIQIGGIGGLAPGRRHDLARLGLRAVLGGSIATLMTATIAGVIAAP
jgi:CNT family concentrative nucleoside transporter